MTDFAPSHFDPWSGTPANDSTGFTVEQLAAIPHLRARMVNSQRYYGLPETYVVPRRYEHHTHAALDKTFDFNCPVVSVTKDKTRLCVISPSGTLEWVKWKK